MVLYCPSKAPPVLSRQSPLDPCLYGERRPTQDRHPNHHLSLRMNHFLHLGIDTHHAIIEVRMIAHQNVRVPCSRHEQGIDTATDRRHEYLTDLQSDEEGESHDYRGESAALVVTGFCELEIQVC